MTVRIEKSGAVWTVIHSRPEVRNAMDPESAAALVAAFNEFNEDTGASVAVLWGEGGAFCAGFDLRHAGSSAGATGIDALAFPPDDQAPLDRASDWNRAARGPMGPTRMELDKPVIAAIAGPAVAGGFELALWCDLRVMESTAYFGVYCRRWGVPLIDGGTVRLPRLVGMGRAMELILTGRKLPADEALRIGACEQVVAEGQSRACAEAIAHQIAGFPQICLRADRRSAGSRGSRSERRCVMSG